MNNWDTLFYGNIKAGTDIQTPFQFQNTDPLTVEYLQDGQMNTLEITGAANDPIIITNNFREDANIKFRIKVPNETQKREQIIW